MSTFPRPPRHRHDDDVHPHLTTTGDEDDLAERITRALRSRGDVWPDAAAVTARIEARLADLADQPSPGTFTRRIVVAGVVSSTLAVVGTGAAAAADPYSDVARTVETAVQAVGIDWSPMPAGYTREQHDAFWDAGYTVGDLDALVDLWDADAIETKARAGQMLLDGEPVPVPAGAHSDGSTDATAPTVPSTSTRAQYDAYFAAGYDYEDAEALAALWSTDTDETKTRAGQMLLDGETPPIAPGQGAGAVDGQGTRAVDGQRAGAADGPGARAGEG